MATQQDIARLVGLDVSSVNKILNRKSGSVFRKETVKRVFRAARELGYDLQKLKFNHRRAHPRKATTLPLEISIYLEDGSLFDRGSGVMKNVSLSGALLSGLVLPLRSLPVRPHTIGLRMIDGPLKGVEIKGKPIRFSHGPEGMSLAVEFIRTEEVDLVEKLRKIV
jgi:transcriptional regulator with XRE-family HTH domain